MSNDEQVFNLKCQCYIGFLWLYGVKSFVNLFFVMSLCCDLNHCQHFCWGRTLLICYLSWFSLKELELCYLNLSGSIRLFLLSRGSRSTLSKMWFSNTHCKCICLRTSKVSSHRCKSRPRSYWSRNFLKFVEDRFWWERYKIFFCLEKGFANASIIWVQWNVAYRSRRIWRFSTSQGVLWWWF